MNNFEISQKEKEAFKKGLKNKNNNPQEVLIKSGVSEAKDNAYVPTTADVLRDEREKILKEIEEVRKLREDYQVLFNAWKINRTDENWLNKERVLSRILEFDEEGVLKAKLQQIDKDTEYFNKKIEEIKRSLDTYDSKENIIEKIDKIMEGELKNDILPYPKG